jgi:hypothetical protein
MNWDKTDILEYLSKLRGYRIYLEICTPTTGGQFAKSICPISTYAIVSCIDVRRISRTV